MFQRPGPKMLVGPQIHLTLENSPGILRGSAWDGDDGGALPPLVLPAPAVGCGLGRGLGSVEGRAKRGVNGANDSTDMSYVITALILQA